MNLLPSTVSHDYETSILKIIYLFIYTFIYLFIFISCHVIMFVCRINNELTQRSTEILRKSGRGCILMLELQFLGNTDILFGNFALWLCEEKSRFQIASSCASETPFLFLIFSPDHDENKNGSNKS